MPFLPGKITPEQVLMPGCYRSDSVGHPGIGLADLLRLSDKPEADECERSSEPVRYETRLYPGI